MAESLSESPPQQGPICPVCFRDYSDSDNNLIPRILQCGHTYCTGEYKYYKCIYYFKAYTGLIREVVC